MIENETEKQFHKNCEVIPKDSTKILLKVTKEKAFYMIQINLENYVTL